MFDKLNNYPDHITVSLIKCRGDNCLSLSPMMIIMITVLPVIRRIHRYALQSMYAVCRKYTNIDNLVNSVVLIG